MKQIEHSPLKEFIDWEGRREKSQDKKKSQFIKKKANCCQKCKESFYVSLFSAGSHTGRKELKSASSRMR